MSEERMRWQVSNGISGKPCQWQLMVRARKRWRCVATVYDNGVWGTWDKRGVGGWNGVCANLSDARLMAAGAALMQGFVNGWEALD